MVFNVSEMEAKVREATNEDPWYVALSYQPSVGRVRVLTRLAITQGSKLDIDDRNRSRVCVCFSCDISKKGVNCHAKSPRSFNL